MMSRAEKRYIFTEDIIAWGHGKYTREYLAKLNMRDLTTLHGLVYYRWIEEINAIAK